MARCRDGVKGPKNGGQGGSGFGGGGFTRGPREMFPAICATCGKECTVPFGSVPSLGRPDNNSIGESDLMFFN